MEDSGTDQELEMDDPGRGGHEQPMRTRTGVMVLYCFNPATGEHAYINTTTDLFISDEEVSSYGLGG